MGERFRGLLKAAPDAMVIVDQNGLMMLVNGQTEKLFGYHRDDLLGHPIEMLIPERLTSRHRGHRRDYRQDLRPRPMGGRGSSYHGRRRDETEFPVEISLSPVRTENSIVVTGAIRDITERREAELTLQRYMRELERNIGSWMILSTSLHTISRNRCAESPITRRFSPKTPPTRWMRNRGNISKAFSGWRNDSVP